MYSYYVLMASINISLKKDAYEFLKSLKSKDRSFSDVILEFKNSGANKNIMGLFGSLKELNIDYKSKEKRMMAFRESFGRKVRGIKNDRIR